MSRFLIAVMLVVFAGMAHAQQQRSDQETMHLLLYCAAYMEVTSPIDQETKRLDHPTNPTLDKADLMVAMAILMDQAGALGTLRRLRMLKHNMGMVSMMSNGRAALAETHGAKCADFEREVDYWKQKRLERAK